MSREPRVLEWDIETSEMIVKAFQLSNDGYINYSSILQDWYIFCAAWKWGSADKVYSTSILDFDTFKPFSETGIVRYPDIDKGVVVKLHSVLSMADVVVGHNSDRFDLKKFNARAVFHGLPPIPPIIQVDTLKIAKQHFKFTSNRLDYLGDFLGVGHKYSTPKGLWDKCLMGDIKALKTMRTYNKRDVTLLHDVYQILRPYAPARANYNLFKDTDSLCPSCGSGNIEGRGHRYTRSGKMQRYFCIDCRGWSQKPARGVAR